ncbi:MAG TPA: hypothetical protein VGY32_11405 [Solirubrobacteraceae bacterium]|nr:hypothetical protein [Solirubrobacteraceae bacterium]
MARYADENARRAYYVKKYGEVEGERRYRKAGAPKPPLAEDAPLEQPQGSLLEQLTEKRPRRRVPKPSRNELILQVGTGIALLDQATMWVYPPWREESLSHEEIGRLADALADEILNSEKLTAWVQKAAKNSVHMKLGLVIAGIALPRMQRRGMIPAGMMPADANGNSPYPEGAPDGSQLQEGSLPQYDPAADMYARMPGEASA